MSAKKKSVDAIQHTMSERDIALWENDVSNLMGDEAFRRKVELGLFQYLERSGLSPEQAYPYPQSHERREAYRNWLADRGRK